jgi:hypothetical protein
MGGRISVISSVGGFAAAAGLGLAVYVLAVRPWHRRWGAADEEVASPMPGDELVARANFHTTRAISVAAPPSAVWAWLVQIGQGRAGFYSYDFLENLMGLDIHSSHQIRSELQDLQVGDTIAVEPGGSGFQVAALEPNRLLLAYIGGETPGEMGDVFARAGAASSWSFLLKEQVGGGTRLVVRWRARWPLFGSGMGLLIWLALEPVEFLMEQRMMRGIKQRAEAAWLRGVIV